MNLQKIGTLYPAQLSCGLSPDMLPLLSLLTERATKDRLHSQEPSQSANAVTYFSTHTELASRSHKLLKPAQVRSQLSLLIASQVVSHHRDEDTHLVELDRDLLQGEPICLVRPLLRKPPLTAMREIVVFSLLLHVAERNYAGKRGVFLVFGEDLQELCATCNLSAGILLNSLKALERRGLIRLKRALQAASPTANSAEYRSGSNPAATSAAARELSTLGISFAVGMEHSFRALAA
ncbi:MAG: hypothetical protein IJ228_05570 [Succinivibrio sp.]|nr:hypothetical protein [Succinivibrio sp.]